MADPVYLDSVMVNSRVLSRRSGDTLYVEKAGMENITLKNKVDNCNGAQVAGNMDCDYHFTGVSWEMIARDIARNYTFENKSIDVSDDQAKALGDILMKDNSNYKTPIEVSRGQKTSFGVRFILRWVYGDHDYSQYNSYLYFTKYQSNTVCLKVGRVPPEFGFNIHEFLLKLAEMTKQGEQPVAVLTQTPVAPTPAQKPPIKPPVAPLPPVTPKPLKVSIAVSSPDALVVELLASLPKGYNAASYEWTFDDGKTMTGRQITREYSREEYRFQKDQSQKTGFHSVILNVTTVDGKITSAEESFKVLLKKENF